MILTITLAGANFRPKETKDHIKELLHIGDECGLRRDASNQYDERAVQIFSGDVFIGFVPKSDNLALSQAMDQAIETGEQFSYRCVCTGFISTLQPTFEIEFEAPWLVERDVPPPARKLNATDFDDEIPF